MFKRLNFVQRKNQSKMKIEVLKGKKVSAADLNGSAKDASI